MSTTTYGSTSPAEAIACPSDWAGSPLSTIHRAAAQVPSVSVTRHNAGMNAAAHQKIVVGVHGSPASVRALRWAADEATRLDAQLKIVLIWRIEPRAHYAPAVSPEDYDRRQEHSVSGLAATVHAVAGTMPRDTVTTEVTQGVPERLLVEQSDGADLLVLGSAYGLGSGRAIGAVIRACLSHAHCPVVVVGPEGPNSHARNHEHLVV
jgi:nucleotide-binding universal stress UspA family protein